MMMNIQRGQLSELNEVFRTAYARQGMSYEPIEGDAYESDELI